MGVFVRIKRNAGLAGLSFGRDRVGTIYNADVKRAGGSAGAETRSNASRDMRRRREEPDRNGY